MSDKYQDRWIAERKKGKIYVTHKDDHTLNKKFDTVKQAQYYVQSIHPKLIYDEGGNYQGYDKPKSQSPTALDYSRQRIISKEFADPIQARSDSSRVYKAGGGDEFEPASDKKKRLTDRSADLIEKITVAEKQLLLPSFKDKHQLIQKSLDNYRSELQSISSDLGVEYQLPSGDATIDQSGGGLSFLPWNWGDNLSDEEKFKRDKKKELTDLVARGEVELPKKWQSNPQKWVDMQVQKSLKDRLVIDSNTSVEELIKISGKQ